MRAEDEHGYDTPEEAAAPEIPARYQRVVRVKYKRRGREAIVELLTNEEPVLHRLTVGCVKDDNGRWHEEWSVGG